MSSYNKHLSFQTIRIRKRTNSLTATIVSSTPTMPIHLIPSKETNNIVAVIDKRHVSHARCRRVRLYCYYDLKRHTEFI